MPATQAPGEEQEILHKYSSQLIDIKAAESAVEACGGRVILSALFCWSDTFNAESQPIFKAINQSFRCANVWVSSLSHPPPAQSSAARPIYAAGGRCTFKPEAEGISFQEIFSGTPKPRFSPTLFQPAWNWDVAALAAGWDRD